MISNLPNRGDYRNLSPFRYWCQKVLPLVYDDSLSYYELLCKVVDYLNKTMEDVETLNGDITSLHSAYNELIKYVNSYLDNLDVQDAINKKLDNMVISGEFNRLLGVYIDPFVEEFKKEVDDVNLKYTSVQNQIDELVKLPSGSTSGDAELTNIRVGYNGQLYETAGNAVRGQITQLHSEIDTYLLEKITSKNIYNKNGDVEGQRLASDGTLEAQNLYITSYFIGVKDAFNVTFTMNKFGDTVSSVDYCLYDAEYKAIGTTQTGSSQSSNNIITIPINPSAVYMRFSFVRLELEDNLIMVNVGTEALPYEEYSSEVDYVVKPSQEVVNARGGYKNLGDRLNAINSDSLFVTPEMFGAIGDGVTDDSDAINNAISESNGGNLIFPQKTYLISKTINIPYSDEKRININLNGATIKYTGNTYAINVGYDATSEMIEYGSGSNAKRFSLYNGTIKSVNNVGTCMLIAENFKNTLIYGLTILQFENGIVIGGEKTSNKPSDALLDSLFIRGNGSSLENGNGIVFNGSDCKLVNSRFYGFNKCLFINSGGVVLNNNHFVFTGEYTNEKDLLTKKCCAIYCANNGVNMGDSIYFDSYPKGIMCENKSVRWTLSNVIYYTYINSMKCTLFDFSNATGDSQISVNGCNISAGSLTTNNIGYIGPSSGNMTQNGNALFENVYCNATNGSLWRDGDPIFAKNKVTCGYSVTWESDVFYKMCTLGVGENAEANIITIMSHRFYLKLCYMNGGLKLIDKSFDSTFNGSITIGIGEKTNIINGSQQKVAALYGKLSNGISLIPCVKNEGGGAYVVPNQNANSMSTSRCVKVDNPTLITQITITK